MKVFLRKFPLFLSCFVLPLTTFAWNALGHMVVANIAYQHLNATSQQKVDALINYLHQEYPEINSYIEAAVWPDAIRSQKIETFTHWHYIDYSISTDGTPLKNVIDTDNSEWAINTIEPIVANNKANNFERARFLTFLSHIVADMHQPLHTVSNFTAKNTNGDKGGNLYFVIYQKQHMTLHKLWDDGVGLFTGDDSPAQVNELTKRIQADYPESYFGNKVVNLQPSEWSQEGVSLAKSNVYVTPDGQPVSQAYLDTNNLVIEQQVALAGYRLANLLNSLLS